MKFASKVFSLPHLQLLIAATGVAEFLDHWLVYLNSRLIVPGIDGIDKLATKYLSELWKMFLDARPWCAQLTATVYHFGFSELNGEVRAFAYRSTEGFVSEPLGMGFGLKPHIQVPAQYNLPEDFLKIMMMQRDSEMRRPPAERIHIGGQVILYELYRDSVSAFPIARFEDIGECEDIIFAGTFRSIARSEDDLPLVVSEDLANGETR